MPGLPQLRLERAAPCAHVLPLEVREGPDPHSGSHLPQLQSLGTRRMCAPNHTWPDGHISRTEATLSTPFVTPTGSRARHSRWNTPGLGHHNWPALPPPALGLRTGWAVQSTLLGSGRNLLTLAGCYNSWNLDHAVWLYVLCPQWGPNSVLWGYGWHRSWILMNVQRNKSHCLFQNASCLANLPMNRESKVAGASRNLTGGL